MSVVMHRAAGPSRDREAVAVDRITGPLSGGDFGRDHHADALVAFGRRGSRDAVFASCARRGTWDDTMARLAFSGTVGNEALPLMTRQNVAMFATVCAWRADLYDVAGTIVGQTPEWQEHRGMTVLAAVIASGAPFSGWEAAMRGVEIQTCLDFEN